MKSGCRTRDVSLREMIQAMSHLPDDAVFRWFQTVHDGHPSDTLKVTVGQARREAGDLRTPCDCMIGEASDEDEPPTGSSGWGP